MTFSQMITISVVAVICAVLAFPSGAHALPKGTKWQNCTAQNLNTRFGSSCVSQAEQDIMSSKSYSHILFCGSGDMLCCTVSNSTGEVINCRKPAESSLAQRATPQLGAILAIAWREKNLRNSPQLRTG